MIANGLWTMNLLQHGFRPLLTLSQMLWVSQAWFLYCPGELGVIQRLFGLHGHARQNGMKEASPARNMLTREISTLVVAVPSNVVWKSMLPLRKKLVLVAVCSLTVFMMICAIIRIGVGTKGKSTDLSWFLVWNSVEMTLGMSSSTF